MSFIASGGGVGQEWKTAPSVANHIEMFEVIRALATSESVESGLTFTVPVGGSGYAVGDFIEITGAGEVIPAVLAGTRATFEVSAVSGGAVTAVRIRQSGAYTTTPAAASGSQWATSALTGGGSGAEIGGISFEANGWTVERVTQEVTAATIGDATGSGYAPGDSIEVSGGDTRTGITLPQSTNPAALTVPGTISTGQAFTVADGGIYHRQPGTDEVATARVTGAGNNAMTVDLTFSDFADTTTDREMILTSTDGFHVGIRTFTSGGLGNFEIMGMQEYAPGNDWDAQLVQSPGRYPDNDSGCFVVLENESFDYFLQITDRRIILTANIGVGIYSNMWLGAFDNFGTAAQYPTPLAVIGCSSLRGLNQGSAESRWAGMNLCISASSGDEHGPGSVLTPGEGWVNLRCAFGNASNNDIDSTNTASYDTAIATPGGSFDVQGVAFESQDEFLGHASVSAQREQWGYFCLAHDPDENGSSTVESNANERRFLTMGNEGGDEFPTLFDITLANLSGANPRLLGELGGVRWLDQRIDGGSGLLSSEDEIDDGSSFWYVFNNCRLARVWSFFAMQGA